LEEIARILQVVDGWLLYDARTNPWGLPPVLRSLMADKCSEVFFFLEPLTQLPVEVLRSIYASQPYVSCSRQ
jgi:hypothetical protein